MPGKIFLTVMHILHHFSGSHCSSVCNENWTSYLHITHKLMVSLSISTGPLSRSFIVTALLHRTIGMSFFHRFHLHWMQVFMQAPNIVHLNAFMDMFLSFHLMLLCSHYRIPRFRQCMMSSQHVHLLIVVLCRIWGDIMKTWRSKLTRNVSIWICKLGNWYGLTL